MLHLRALRARRGHQPSHFRVTIEWQTLVPQDTPSQHGNMAAAPSRHGPCQLPRATLPALEAGKPLVLEWTRGLPGERPLRSAPFPSSSSPRPSGRERCLEPLVLECKGVLPGEGRPCGERRPPPWQRWRGLPPSVQGGGPLPGGGQPPRNAATLEVRRKEGVAPLREAPLSRRLPIQEAAQPTHWRSVAIGS